MNISQICDGRRALLALTLLACGLSLTGPGYAAEQTAWGTPRLEGVWDFRTITPLERPEEFADKAVLSKAEASALTGKTLSRFVDIRVEDNAALDLEGSYNAFWLDRGTSLDEGLRTSLIVDPPDGRLPAILPEAKARMLAQNQARMPFVRDYFSYSVGPDYLHADPESLGLSERCLVGFNAGPPLTPSAYNNNLRIIQTPDHVVLVTEMIHQARIVPLKQPGAVPADLEQWMGRSVGWWEGDTLVVQTSHFSEKTPAYQLPIVITDPDASGAIGSGSNMHLTERFTRAGEGRLDYEYTLDAPDAFVRPFTVRFSMRATDDQLFEYACHEGNYAMGGILRGARLAEKEAIAAKADHDSRSAPRP
ncbi:MAG: hypothetical protein O3A63_07105 [Proteobacteria bacterium]|nr:hypothetical protein [Pseudomonadota bacterium]